MLSVYITYLITLIRSGNANEEIWAELDWAQSEEQTFYRNDLVNHLSQADDKHLHCFKDALLKGTEKKLIQRLKAGLAEE